MENCVILKGRSGRKILTSGRWLGHRSEFEGPPDPFDIHQENWSSLFANPRWKTGLDLNRGLLSYQTLLPNSNGRFIGHGGIDIGSSRTVTNLV